MQLIPLIDGRRDVTTLIDASGLGEFEVGKALYALVTAGFLHRVGKSRPVDDGVREARVEEHRNLGVAFYKTAMFEEATREFRRVVELNESDVPARFFLGLVAMREGKWSEAVLTLREAAAQPNVQGRRIYHNLAYALERMGHYDEAREALQEAIQRGGAGGSAHRGRRSACSRCKSGDVDEADAAAHRGAHRSGGSARRRRRGSTTRRSRPALAGELDRALAIVIEGVEAHPHAAVLLQHLAAVHERRGDHDRGARRPPSAALHEDGSIPQLLQEPRRLPLPRVALRRGARGVPAGDQARSRARRRRVLQARQHPLQVAGDGPGARVLGARARARTRTTTIVRTNLDLVRTMPE